MKCTLLLFCAVAICFGAYAASSDFRSGVWTATIDDDDPGKLHISLVHGKDRSRPGHAFNNMMGFTVPLSSVTGLSTGDVNSAAANVQFTMTRAAGTIQFEGRFSEGNGAGNFKFTPNEQFVRDMGSLGYSDFTDNDLIVFASTDFTPQVIRDLRQLGYEPTRKEVVELAIFRVDAGLVREFARLGYPNLTLRELVEMRVGRVDAAYINGMRELGFQLSAREAANLAILGVTPAYVRELKSAGLTNLSARQLENLRVGNVTPKRIEEYRRMGYGNLEPRQLADFGIHGVTPQFIQELRDLGYNDIPTSKLIEMKIFGVTPEYIRRLEKQGYKGVPVEKMLQLRQSGLIK